MTIHTLRPMALARAVWARVNMMLRLSVGFIKAEALFTIVTMAA